MVERPTLDRRTVLKALGAGTLFSGMGVASAADYRSPIRPRAAGATR